MKKVFMLLSAALLVTGVTFAQDKDQKKKCAKGKSCCQKKHCSKDKEKSEKPAEEKAN